MLTIAYVIFFLILYYKCRKYKFPALDFVIIFYLIASVSGVLMNFFITDNPCTVFSFAYQVLIFYLFLKPIIYYGKHEQQRKFVMISDRRFLLITYALIGLQLFAIAYFIAWDVRLLTSGDLAQVRSELIESESNELGTSIFRTIAGTSSYYYGYNILLFFYSLAFRKDHKLLLVLLILSSTSRIFHALTYMGRDGLLFWILSFVFTFFMFKPYLGKEADKLIKKVLAVCGTFAVLLIGAITISRFGESDEGAFWSLITYMGVPIDNFAKVIHSPFADWSGSKSMFPLLYGENVQSSKDLIASVEAFEAKYGFRNNEFASFVGNMYMAWGTIITLLVSIIYSSYMTKKTNRELSSLSVMTILMIASQIAVNNYFYWAFYLRVGNLFLLTTPVFVIYFNKSRTGKIIDAIALKDTIKQQKKII